jgi:deferrochelatase/peroxidase EfeB
MRRCPVASRRGLLAAAGGLVAAAASGPARAAATGGGAAAREPFWGVYQGGILTAQQRHACIAAFDLTTAKREAVAALLRGWTEAAARMATGETAAPLGADPSVPAPDAGDALDLGAARLTVTIGFGAGLFVKNGVDRYGLAGQRPAALVDLPRFHGDQLIAEKSDGDLFVQACAEDAQVAFHAVRELAALAYGVADKRWVQMGFLPATPDGGTPRNLMGFKDGTNNPATGDAAAMARVVWVGAEGPAWMERGTYLVFRRIRIALEHWDRTEVDFQEETIGRRKYSGAPLTGTHEFDPLDLDRTDAEGEPVIGENAHVRLAAPASNGGAAILRRGYSYNDGVAFTAERWPPWRQGMLYDAGLLFLAFQRDPRTGFIKIFEPMAKIDALNQFTTHTASGVFACPGGAAPGEFIGQRLFMTG